MSESIVLMGIGLVALAAWVIERVVATWVVKPVRTGRSRPTRWHVR